MKPVIPFTLVGNKIVYKQLSSAHLIGYLLSHLFNEHSWNNCYILHVLAGIMYGAALAYFKEKYMFPKPKSKLKRVYKLMMLTGRF